ncbi:MAG: hypothetical protein LC135_05495 [Phycisphaerae bacterium]|nr:hypothetical protein [Phycisphaerae bacterium]MCZ2399309.1 hypothetical protein [Phycisphaerae bacterium]
MGEFVLRQVDAESGRELTRFVASNFLAYEGLRYVLRQIFPPYDAAMTFQLGVCGATTGDRPNPGGGATFGPELTFAQCTNANANEGGCYTQGMRTSFGYARHNVAFTASLEADGGALICPEATFPNNHSWSPQAVSAWDFPWTPDDVEQPPPEWTPKESWEPEVGYPWQRPRKRCHEDCDPYDPQNCLRSYMHTWDSTGELDWLCDFRKMGGFPITMAFLADSSRSKLVAAAGFRAPILLRPGTSLHARYQARIFGSRLSRDFALRFAKYAFEKTGSRYTTISCRPLLTSAPKITRRTTYAEIEPHFASVFAAVALATWNYVAGPPPRVESASTPQWTNGSGAALGPFGGLAVFGSVGGGNELMWVTPIDPPVSVQNGDTLRVPSKVKFQLDGV